MNLTRAQMKILRGMLGIDRPWWDLRHLVSRRGGKPGPSRNLFVCDTEADRPAMAALESIGAVVECWQGLPDLGDMRFYACTEAGKVAAMGS